MKVIIALLAVTAVAYGSVPKLDGKIVGGQAVSIVDYPYQVSVRYYNQHMCGGSILDETTILTAAHCVHGFDPNYYSVRVGSTRHASGEHHVVSRVTYNSNYDPEQVNNDVAILKLDTPIEFSEFAQPIELQSPGVEVPAGTTAWVSGWGALQEGSQNIPASLRAVDVQVITNFQCGTKYGFGKITEHMMCAQTISHDSCQGDSGGPLVANGKLIGVVSWGYGCARPQYPGVYSKVSNLYNWIVANK